MCRDHRPLTCSLNSANTLTINRYPDFPPAARRRLTIETHVLQGWLQLGCAWLHIVSNKVQGPKKQSPRKSDGSS